MTDILDLNDLIIIGALIEDALEHGTEVKVPSDQLVHILENVRKEMSPMIDKVRTEEESK